MTGRVPITHQDWMRNTNRRVSRQERKRLITSSFEILGPGLAAQATQVVDWNDETMDFNGIYCCDLGSLNSPDPTKKWIGTCYTDDDGNGMQIVMVYLDDPLALAAWTPVRKARAFVSPDDTTRLFSTWQTA